MYMYVSIYLSIFLSLIHIHTHIHTIIHTMCTRTYGFAPRLSSQLDASRRPAGPPGAGAASSGPPRRQAHLAI